MTQVGLAGFRPDPELMHGRDGSNPGPDCPSCGTFSTRLSMGRFWCANIRCDAVFRYGGAGLEVAGRVVRRGDAPIAVLPTARVRGLGPRLDEGLGEEVPVSTTDMTWYSLRVEAGREGVVRDDVGMMRLATYSPIRLTWRQIKRRRCRSNYEPVERALFPGYLFLGAWRGYAVDWLAVRSIKHVIAPVLTGDGAPSMLAGDVIRSLIHREVAGEFRDAAPDAPKPPRRDRPLAVAVGDSVEIGSSGYTDKVLSVEGIYAALERSGVKVHVDSLRRAS